MSGLDIKAPRDARSLRSRRALREALLRLIQNRALADISIKEITAEAGVSYPVFFRQFTRKEELLDDIARSEIAHLPAYSMLEEGTREAGVVALCVYVQEHRAIWTQLLTTGAAEVMRVEFLRRARQFTAKHGREMPELPQTLVSNLTVGGIFEVLAWWLLQPENYPITNVVTLLRALVIEPVYRPIALEPFVYNEEDASMPIRGRH